MFISIERAQRSIYKFENKSWELEIFYSQESEKSKTFFIIVKRLFRIEKVWQKGERGGLNN